MSGSRRLLRGVCSRAPKCARCRCGKLRVELIVSGTVYGRVIRIKVGFPHRWLANEQM